MKNNNLDKRFVITLILGVMFLLPIVSAIAVSVPHMEEIDGVDTYEVYKDNVEDFKVVLQTGTEDPVNIKVEILEGSDVIELIDSNDIFLVSPGEKIPVQFRIVSPPGAEIGDSFYVRLGFRSSEVGVGALAFGTAVEQRFNVLLVEIPIETSEVEKEKTGKAALIISFGILLLLVILIVMGKIRNDKKSKTVKKSVEKKESTKKTPVKKKK